MNESVPMPEKSTTQKTRAARIMKMAVWILGIYGVYLLILFVAQRQMMFPRYVLPLPQPEGTLPAGVESIWMDFDFGRVEAWYLPASPGPRTSEAAPALIVAHGNGELIDYMIEEVRPFQHIGMAVLLVEYPGYGRSRGSPSQKSIGEIFLRAYDRLVQRPEIDPKRIVLLGRSLGGGAVCDLSRKRPSAAMILVSTFTRTSAFAKRYLAPPLLIRDPFDNLGAVQGYPNPLLITHGKHDEMIPYHHGELLFRAASRGTMKTYSGGHNDLRLDAETCWRDIEAFLRDTGILGPALAPHMS